MMKNKSYPSEYEDLAEKGLKLESQFGISGRYFLW